MKRQRPPRRHALLPIVCIGIILLFVIIIISLPMREVYATHGVTFNRLVLDSDTRARLKYTPAMEARLPFVPRPEVSVDMEQFYYCMSQRMGVDLMNHTQQRLVAEDTIPMLVFPFMMEVADLRALMCSMHASVRYIVFVHNGGVPEVADFFDDLEAVFGWTGRLTVRRNAENDGFSACVNAGIAAALSYPAEEVPFIFVSNIDVRYTVDGEDVLTKRIRRFHSLVAKDLARIRELEAEEAANSVSGRGRALRGAWSPDATLVTSALLPERIRRMSPEQQLGAFSEHTAITMVARPMFSGAAFGLSRLAMLTVGYWDENFYPAYREDNDYFWRVAKLGFQLETIADDELAAHHYHHAIQKTKLNPALLSPRVTQLLDEFKRFMPEMLKLNYWSLKWGEERYSRHKTYTSHLLFSTAIVDGQSSLSVPLDVWVRDAEYARKILYRNRHGAKQKTARPMYNVSLLHMVTEA